MRLRSSLLLILFGCLDKATVYPDRYNDDDDSPDGDDSNDSGSEDSDGDGFIGNDDCDDTNPEVYPGATEVCDGADNDCDETTSEAQMVHWKGVDGVIEDLSADFLSGTQSSPYRWTGSESGELHFCEGSYFTELTLTQSIAVIGHGDTSSPSLSSGGNSTIVTLEGQGLTFELDTLTLTQGRGSFDSNESVQLSAVGGGIACSGRNDLLLDSVNISRNDASVGGGLFLEQCSLVASETVITQNDATDSGGGLWLYNGSASFTNSEISQNTSTQGAGGLAISSDGVVLSTVTLTDTPVERNQGIHGGATLSAAVLECEGSSDSRGGFLGNSSPDGTGSGAIDLSTNAQLASIQCDWGVPGTADDNTPTDFNVTDSNYADDENFTCTPEGCK